MRRIGVRALLAAVRGFCTMPLARTVAPSESSGRGDGIGQRRGRCCAKTPGGCHGGGRSLHHFGGGFRNGISEGCEPFRSRSGLRQPPAPPQRDSSTCGAIRRLHGDRLRDLIGSGTKTKGAASISMGLDDLVKFRIRRCHLHRDPREHLVSSFGLSGGIERVLVGDPRDRRGQSSLSSAAAKLSSTAAGLSGPSWARSRRPSSASSAMSRAPAVAS